ncbi:patatin-like phospholipase family protein [Sphingomonas sp. ID0503]|uniref:patatin-like phospholipase family protein n=1 Tax=Sphingomonas sp. ID0503 TaxID=3399691 RepID=UPI003AFB7B03
MTGTSPPVQLSGIRIALALGGGNALGAYHAGLYQALDEAGIQPDWILGTSIGAITGAIIAGNPREQRLARLRGFWRPADAAASWLLPTDFLPESWRRSGAVLATLLAGRPGLFGPIGSGPSAWLHPASAAPALYATEVLEGTLAALIDFELLNRAQPRFTAAAIDVVSGEEVLIDSTAGSLRPEHLRASAALLTTYPAIEVDGRVLADGGLSMNLPIDPVLAEPGERPVLCIGSDLLPLSDSPPKTLGETVSRMQDLIFAAQTRRTVEKWQAIYDARLASAENVSSVTLALLSYADQEQEVAGKAMDFSPETVRQRWKSGHRDGCRLLDRLRSGALPTGLPGLAVQRL